MSTEALLTPLAGRGDLGQTCVHVVDDDKHFRSALQLLLASSGYATESYLSAEHFLSVYRPRPTECLLLDLRMPGMNGIELQRELTTRHVAMPIIVISAFAETAAVVSVMRSGAIDFLEKPFEESVVLEKVSKALESDRKRKRGREQLSLRLATLSAREREVMNFFLKAKSTIEIARLLGISPKTVEKHRLKIFDKLQVYSIPELICALALPPALAEDDA